MPATKLLPYQKAHFPCVLSSYGLTSPPTPFRHVCFVIRSTTLETDLSAEGQLEGELLDGLVDGSTEGIGILLSTIGATRDEVNNAESELVDNALDRTQDGGDGGGERSAG